MLQLRALSSLAAHDCKEEFASPSQCGTARLQVLSTFNPTHTAPENCAENCVLFRFSWVLPTTELGIVPFLSTWVWISHVGSSFTSPLVKGSRSIKPFGLQAWDLEILSYDPMCCSKLLCSANKDTSKPSSTSGFAVCLAPPLDIPFCQRDSSCTSFVKRYRSATGGANWSQKIKVQINIQINIQIN